MVVEALVRWQHPVHARVSPLTFIPLAEESGLIVPIGEWVLRAACEQAVAWQAQGMPLRMAVNLSPRQFHRNDFLMTLKTVLQDTCMPTTALELEIT